jgi:hypothetical protein
MLLQARLARFARKPASDQWAAVCATLRSLVGIDDRRQRRLHRVLTGALAPPAVLRNDQGVYVAYRPDIDVVFSRYPEIAGLSEKWIAGNVTNNAGDLPRLYAIILNINQILEENIPGNIAELGVYRGNSASIFAYYCRKYQRQLFLFDTFRGFDERDLVGTDRSRRAQFDDTSLESVRNLVGGQDVQFIAGRFPQSIPADIYGHQFCLAHIDCDLYEPAKAGLEFFYPRLAPGGLLIMHDYANPYWLGIKRAVDEFCRGIPEKPVVFGDKSGTAMIRKSVTP